MIRVGFRLDFIFIFIRLYVYQCTWIEWMLPLLIAWTAEHYVACSLRAINFLWNVIKHSMKVRACLDDKTRNCLIGGRIKMVVKLQCISNFDFVANQGTIPAPILFGTLIDKTCQSWQEVCQDSRGACFIYDNWMMASYLLTLIFCFKGLSFCFFTLALLLYKPPMKPCERTCLTSTITVVKPCTVEPATTNDAKNKDFSLNCHHDVLFQRWSVAVCYGIVRNILSINASFELRLFIRQAFMTAVIWNCTGFCRLCVKL